MVMRAGLPPDKHGRFLASDIRPGEPYELSDGRLIHCEPTGGRGSASNQVGASTLGSDPRVEEVGIDTGYTPKPDVLRAPDIAVGNVPDKPGWVPGAPMLAVEYADTGQDEDKLQEKIADLLRAGTRFIWVVRLAGSRRVEVYEPGKPPRTAWPGEELTAPGVLKNPVRVQALYDRDEANRATLRNLLQRQGYEDLEAVLDRGRDQGREEGRKEGQQRLLRQLHVRFGELPEVIVAQVDAASPQDLDVWAERLLTAPDIDAVFRTQ